MVDVDSDQQIGVEGLILSNSCDVDASNDHMVAPRILFAPLIRLAALRELLIGQGQPKEKVGDYIRSIRKQHVTNVFFLPKGQYGPDESVAYLDDMRPVRLREFLDLSARSRLFRLSMAGLHRFPAKAS